MSALTGLGTIIAVRINSPEQALSFSALALAAASAFLSAGSMVINDWFDADIDRINKPDRPIPSGQISKTQALLFAMALFAAGVISSLLVNYKIALCAGLVVILSAAYSGFLKRYLLLGNLLVAAISCYPLFSGGLLTAGFSRLFIPITATFLFISGREMLKDAEDAQGDSRFGMVSLANTWGQSAAIYWGVALMSVALVVGIGQYLLHINNEWFLICIAPAFLLEFWLAYRLIRYRSERSLALGLDLSAIVMLWSSIVFVIGLR